VRNSSRRAVRGERVVVRREREVRGWWERREWVRCRV